MGGGLPLVRQSSALTSWPCLLARSKWSPMRAASAAGAPLKFAGFAAQETSSGCLVRAQAFALIQRPIWSGKSELHAHASRRTVEVARAAGGVFPRSAGRLSPRDSHCSIGRPESRPGRKLRRLRSASAHLQAGPNCSEQIGPHLRVCSLPELRRCMPRSAVLDFGAPTSAKACAATPRRVSALKSEACAAT